LVVISTTLKLNYRDAPPYRIQLFSGVECAEVDEDSGRKIAAPGLKISGAYRSCINLHISRSRYSPTSNISKTVQDKTIFTVVD